MRRPHPRSLGPSRPRDELRRSLPLGLGRGEDSEPINFGASPKALRNQSSSISLSDMAKFISTLFWLIACCFSPQKALMLITDSRHCCFETITSVHLYICLEAGEGNLSLHRLSCGWELIYPFAAARRSTVHPGEPVLFNCHPIDALLNVLSRCDPRGGIKKDGLRYRSRLFLTTTWLLAPSAFPPPGG